jgi:hypothetical protein
VVRPGFGETRSSTSRGISGSARSRSTPGGVRTASTRACSRGRPAPRGRADLGEAPDRRVRVAAPPRLGLCRGAVRRRGCAHLTQVAGAPARHGRLDLPSARDGHRVPVPGTSGDAHRGGHAARAHRPRRAPPRLVPRRMRSRAPVVCCQRPRVPPQRRP